MRLTRVIWALLAAVLVGALAATWVLTLPSARELPSLGGVRVFAGDGRDGWRDGPADEARFSEPFGVVAAADGRLFVSDAGLSHRIRQIGTDQVVTTIAGRGRGFADGRGSEARFATPSGVALAPDGTLVVADTGNHAVRRVTSAGDVTTVAGDGLAGYRDGPATQARFNAPIGVAVDSAGRIIVADTYNDRIRVIDTDGEVRTLAGGDTGHVDGSGPNARFDTPCGVVVASDGRVLVADTGNGAIRVITADGQVTTITPPSAGLEHPIALAIGATGDLYVADERGAVIVMGLDGDARLVAGTTAGFADGVAAEARFRRPSGLAFTSGTSSVSPGLIVADAGNAMLRAVLPVAGETGSERSGAGTITRWAAAAHASEWPWVTARLQLPARPRVAPAFDEERFARTPLLWPVAPLEGPHEVAGTFGEARGEAGQQRFHAGLDVRENQGAPVRAVRDGIVASPIATSAFETLNESLRVGPLTYIHIRVGRRAQDLRRVPGSGHRVPGPEAVVGTAAGVVAADPTRAGTRVMWHAPADIDLQRFAPVYDAEDVMTRMRAKRGAFFATGDVVGTVNAFNHVHLNVGWTGEEYNPLGFRLVQFSDRIAPSIAAAGVRLFDEAWLPLNPDRLGPARGRGRKRRPTRLPPVEPVLVRGRVRIVVDAWDQADGNKAYRRLGVYSVGYTVDPGGSDDGTSSMPGVPPGRSEPGGRPGVTQVFDRMRREANAAKQVYATGSGIPVYGANRTQFLYVVTTAYRDGIATEGFWDTSMVMPGAHVLQVFVRDFSGNTASRDLRVLVVP